MMMTSRTTSLLLAVASTSFVACTNVNVINLSLTPRDGDGDGIDDSVDTDDDNDGIPDDEDPTPQPPPVDDSVLTTAQVFERLTPTCAGCHTNDLPYFRDLAAFQGAIVTNPAYVVPGSPETSRLLRMLAGNDLSSMPTGAGNSFADQEAAGLTQVSTAQLTAWIASLPPTPVDAPQDVVLMRRKTAEMIERTLADQLGLVQDDFFVVYGAYGLDLAPRTDDTYPARSPDQVPSVEAQAAPGTLWGALGGPWHLEGRARNDAITQTFLQAFTHMSQAWCRLAVEKSSPALFNLASTSDGTAADSLPRVRDTIAAWHLRMLGVPATSLDIDELVAVFQAYEGRSTQAAWTATCATIVRDPLWMTY
jgi:hypothetical protein